MSRIHLTEQQWAFILPLLPPAARTGRPRANDRRTIEGIFYILITDCRWQDLPREYGTPTTVWRRLKWWGEEGVWERMWRAALAALDQQGQLDWSMGFLDGSFAPAKKGGDNVGLTKKVGVIYLIAGVALYYFGFSQHVLSFWSSVLLSIWLLASAYVLWREAARP